jgi:hypothetical protein
MIKLYFGNTIHTEYNHQLVQFKGFAQVIPGNPTYEMDITSEQYPEEIKAELHGGSFIFTLLKDAERENINRAIIQLKNQLRDTMIELSHIKEAINNADPKFGRPYRIDIVYHECGTRKTMAIQGLSELYEIIRLKEEWQDMRNIDHIRVNEDKFTMSELDLLKLRLKYPYVKDLSD